MNKNRFLIVRKPSLNFCNKILKILCHVIDEGHVKLSFICPCKMLWHNQTAVLTCSFTNIFSFNFLIDLMIDRCGLGSVQ